MNGPGCERLASPIRFTVSCPHDHPACRRECPPLLPGFVLACPVKSMPVNPHSVALVIACHILTLSLSFCLKISFTRVWRINFTLIVNTEIPPNINHFEILFSTIILMTYSKYLPVSFIVKRKTEIMTSF